MTYDELNREPNAVNFEKFMNEVWRMDATPYEDGVALSGSPLYERWHNANYTAQHFGAYRTGGSIVGGEYAAVYRFPADNNLVSVRVNSAGTCISLSRRALVHRPKR
jgi:hypothetical protein